MGVDKPGVKLCVYACMCVCDNESLLFVQQENFKLASTLPVFIFSISDCLLMCICLSVSVLWCTALLSDGSSLQAPTPVIYVTHVNCC